MTLRVGEKNAYVEPEALSYGRGRLLVIGQPIYVDSQPGMPRPAAPGVAGVLFEADGRGALVQSPFGARNIFAPRTYYDDRTGWHVLWIERAPGDSNAMSQLGTVVHAVFDGRAWTQPRRASSPHRFFHNPALSSQIVKTSRGLQIALPVHRSDLDSGIVILTMAGGKWREASVPRVRRALYVSTEEAGGELIVIYAGIGADDTNALSVVRSRAGVTGWSSPMAIARGVAYDPQIVASDSILAIGWVSTNAEDFSPRGVQASWSRDGGATWTPAKQIGGADATSLSVNRMLRGAMLFVTHGPLAMVTRGDEIIIARTGSEAYVRRDSTLPARLVLNPVELMADGFVALGTMRNPLSPETLPTMSLLRARVACGERE